MRTRYIRYAEVGVMILVGAVFLYAGAIKWKNPLQLADTIEAYRLSLGRLNNFAAMLLPPIEIFAVLALIHSRTRRAGLLMLGALCVLFLAALAQAMARGLIIDCGCFGSKAPTREGMFVALGRDLLICGATLWLIFQDYLKRKALHSKPAKELHELITMQDVN